MPWCSWLLHAGPDNQYRLAAARDRARYEREVITSAIQDLRAALNVKSILAVHRNNRPHDKQGRIVGGTDFLFEHNIIHFCICSKLGWDFHMHSKSSDLVKFVFYKVASEKKKRFIGAITLRVHRDSIIRTNI